MDELVRGLWMELMFLSDQKGHFKGKVYQSKMAEFCIKVT